MVLVKFELGRAGIPEDVREEAGTALGVRDHRFLTGAARKTAKGYQYR